MKKTRDILGWILVLLFMPLRNCIKSLPSAICYGTGSIAQRFVTILTSSTIDGRFLPYKKAPLCNLCFWYMLPLDHPNEQYKGNIWV